MPGDPHWHTKKEPQRYNDMEERVIHGGWRTNLPLAKPNQQILKFDCTSTNKHAAARNFRHRFSLCQIAIASVRQNLRTR